MRKIVILSLILLSSIGGYSRPVDSCGFVCIQLEGEGHCMWGENYWDFLCQLREVPRRGWMCRSMPAGCVPL